MKTKAKKFLALLCAGLLTAAVLPAGAEEGEAAEEQGVEEIQQLLEVSEVENTEGLGLEELTEAFMEKAMSDYADSTTGFRMQYPSSFTFGEDLESMVAYTPDGSASLVIENMQGGNLTEEVMLEAIRLETPDAEIRKYELNNCLRVDTVSGDGSLCQTDLYLICKDSFHHVTIKYPAEEKETYRPLIEYMINTMETEESDLG